MNALDERTRNVFLHNVKLDIERKVVEDLKNVGGYERLRLTTLQRSEILVVLESECLKCPYYIPGSNGSFCIQEKDDISKYRFI